MQSNLNIWGDWVTTTHMDIEDPWISAERYLHTYSNHQHGYCKYKGAWGDSGVCGEPQVLWLATKVLKKTHGYLNLKLYNINGLPSASSNPWMLMLIWLLCCDEMQCDLYSVAWCELVLHNLVRYGVIGNGVLSCAIQIWSTLDEEECK